MITIQDMTASAVPLVAALEAQTFPTPWTKEDIFRECSNPWAVWLIAIDDLRLAGYLGIQYGPDGADIMSIAVDPMFRRRGIAGMLINTMCDRLIHMGLNWLTLEVRASNTSAIALYQSLGFQTVGLRPRYYSKPREDAILMTRTFSHDNKSGGNNADIGN